MSAIDFQECWFDEFHLRVGARELLRSGVPVPMGAKAFDLLTQLVVNAGSVVSKDQLLQSVWHSSHVDESNLAQQVLALRRALGDRSGLVMTIPGRGYQFTAAVRKTPSTLPVEMSVETITQTVRERSRMVIEEPMPMPAMHPVQAFPVQRRRWMYAACIAVVALAGAAGVVAWKRAQPRATDEFHSLVVADFASNTGDVTFDQALKRALEIEMGQSPTLSVMSGGEAAGILRSMGQKPDATLAGDLVREVCVRGNRQILLRGAIASVGQMYLLTLEATDCRSGKRLADAKQQANSKDAVLAALDGVADQVRSKLGESAKSLASYDVPIVQATTPSLDALEAYSMGVAMVAQGKDDAASMVLFQRAVELDPKFAMAWSEIANAHYNLGEGTAASEDYKKAFDLSGNGSTHEKLTIRAHYYGEGLNDVPEAIQSFQLWAQTFPHDWAPLVDICNCDTQNGLAPAAIPACEQGLAMRPDRAISYSVLTRALLYSSRLDEAEAVAQRAVQQGKDSPGVHDSLIQLALLRHDAAAIARETAWADGHNDSWYQWMFPYKLASAAAAEGRHAQAVKLFRNSYETALRENLPEDARSILLDEARIELNLGLSAAAHKTLGPLTPADMVGVDAVLLQARLGDTGPAQQYIAAHRAAPPSGTLDAYVNLPEMEAALALQRGKPDEAIAALEAARPYELSSLDVPATRAAAYLKLGRPDLAALAYKEILQNPGADSTSVLHPLAHLGLARAYAAQSQPGLSRVEYESFLTAWKNADPDLPVLQAARVEMARLKR
jgi:DNA-binding winged helix-turn-helix (wHTH) protein/tetratricopeptide (TPR) repeat protein